MKLRSLSSARFDKGAVITIGNFDGVHKGHQKLLFRLNQLGQSLNLPTVVVLFEPQPLEYFKRKSAPPRLMKLRDKIEAIAENGIDHVVYVKFNKSLSNMSPSQFSKHILKDRINAKHILIGEDFCFGKDRKGNVDTLITQGKELGFEVEVQETIKGLEGKFSSSLVRKAYQEGNISDAEEMLGRSLYISGKVGHGDKRGREIGVPTANISITKEPLLFRGVYGVDVFTEIDNFKQQYKGVANIGYRPTVDGKKPLLEVHLLDSKNCNLYGKRLKVHIKFKIRDEQKFDSFDLLIKQIHNDIEIAREKQSQLKAVL